VNILAVLTAAIAPLIIGFVWYNPKVFGNTWVKVAHVSEEKMKSVNMILIFSLTFILSFLLAFVMQFLVVHQAHVKSLFFLQPIDDASTEMGALYQTIMQKLGSSYRTFKHGALHGTMSGIFIALPIIGVNALFERKGFKYVAINTGFWIICMAIMGGIVSAWV
jgi:predicted permease